MLWRRIDHYLVVVVVVVVGVGGEFECRVIFWWCPDLILSCESI